MKTARSMLIHGNERNARYVYENEISSNVLRALLSRTSTTTYMILFRQIIGMTCSDRSSLCTHDAFGYWLDVNASTIALQSIANYLKIIAKNEIVLQPFVRRMKRFSRWHLQWHVNAHWSRTQHCSLSCFYVCKKYCIGKRRYSSTWHKKE